MLFRSVSQSRYSSPLSIDLGEGDYEAGDPVECTVSFSFDRAVRTGLVDLVASSIQA